MHSRSGFGTVSEPPTEPPGRQEDRQGAVLAVLGDGFAVLGAVLSVLGAVLAVLDAVLAVLGAVLAVLGAVLAVLGRAARGPDQPGSQDSSGSRPP